MENPESRNTSQIGGFVVTPEGGFGPAADAGEVPIEKVTRSTGDEHQGAHAEARLLAQVKRLVKADERWAGRVRVLDIQITHSPCQGCTVDLIELRALLPNLRLAVLHWGERHRQSGAREISALRRANYSVFGP